MPALLEDNSRSISQVSRMIRSLVEAETLEQFFWVGGKVERYYKSERGHSYFDLVDDRVRIRCMLREERVGNISFDLRNHLEVEVYGDVHFFEARAAAEINVLDMRAMDTATAGAPVVEQLRSEGLYPPTKKSAPASIERIGLVTSQSSRAVDDFQTAYQSAGERGVLAPLIWQYVMLEGDRAARSIADGIVALDNNPEIDAIVVVRGGGRYENLAVFDDIEVVRAIIACDTYVVTGIGHHRDHTLADDVADYVVSTPTAAATYLAGVCLKAQSESGKAGRSRTILLVFFALLLLVLAVVAVMMLASVAVQPS